MKILTMAVAALSTLIFSCQHQNGGHAETKAIKDMTEIADDVQVCLEGIHAGSTGKESLS